MPKHSSPKPKVHLVIGKIYSDGCIFCIMMKDAWDKMKEQIKEDMHSVNKPEDSILRKHEKYVSNDGNRVVEIIEIETSSIDEELPYVQKHYSPDIVFQDQVPTIFKVDNDRVSYYGGERTADKMKDWCLGNKKISGGSTRRKRKARKTKKNRTRGRYTRSRTDTR